MNHYSSNLTDNQWQVIEKFLDVQVRKRKYSQKHSKRNHRRWRLQRQAFVRHAKSHTGVRVGGGASS